MIVKRCWWLKLLRSISFLFIFLLSQFSLANISEEVNESVSPQYTCGGYENNFCPPFLEERIEYLSDTGFWDTQSPAQRCLAKEEFQPIQQFFDVNARELDAALHDSHLGYNGGSLANYGANCFEGRRGEIQDLADRFQSISENCRGRDIRNGTCDRSAIRSMSRELEPNIKVADNYLSHLKLRSAQEEALRSLNSIGSLLGESSPMPYECSNVAYPQTLELCRAIKSDHCGLKAQAAEARTQHLEFTKSVLKSYRAIELEKRELLRTRPGVTLESQEEYRQAINEYQELDTHLEQLLARAPWVTGEAFKDQLNMNSRQFNRLFEDGNEEEFNRLVQEGFDAQMRANRENLLEQMRDYTKSANCLRGSEECDEDDFNQTLSLTPPIDLDRLDLPNKNHLSFAQCMHEDALERDDRNGLITSIAVGAGLTVASIFVPPLGIARAVQFGAAAMRANTGVRFAAGYAARNLTRAPASLAVVLGDSAFVATGMADAAQTCSAGSDDQVQFDLHAQPLSGSPQCENESNSLQARFQHIPSGCASALLFAGLDATPFAAFGVRRFQELRRIRLTDAEIGIPHGSPLSGARRNETFDQHVLSHHRSMSPAETDRLLRADLEQQTEAMINGITNLREREFRDMINGLGNVKDQNGARIFSDSEVDTIEAALRELRENGTEPPFWMIAAARKNYLIRHFPQIQDIGYRDTRTSFFPEGVTEADVLALPPDRITMSTDQGALRLNNETGLRPENGTIAYEAVSPEGNQYLVVICRRANGCSDNTTVSGPNGESIPVNLNENEILSVFPTCGPGVTRYQRPMNLWASIVSSRAETVADIPSATVPSPCGSI